MSLAQRLGLAGPSNIPKRFLPFYQQAGSEALVRYAPQYDALEQLRASSAQTMRQRVAQARSAGAIASNSATLAASELAKGPNANAPAIQSVIQMLGQRAADAPIVATQQAQQATNDHLADLDKIHAQRASLLGQIGTFTIGRATDLVGSDRKLRHDVNTQRRTLEQQTKLATQRDITTRRGQDISHTDRQAAIDQRRDAAALRNKGRLPGGVKLATPQQHGALKDKVGSAVALVNKQKGLGRSRQEIAQLLLNGRPAQTITLQPGDEGYSATDPTKNKVHAPAVPKVPQLALSAALDLAFDSHISHRNVGELHQRGYSVRKLGYQTKPTRRRPKAQRVINAPPLTPLPPGNASA